MENTVKILPKWKVYYGWAKVNKIRKKPAISILFSNEFTYESDRIKRTISNLQTTIYTRLQTAGEIEDGKKENRVLTEFSLFLFDKHHNGDLEKLLENNYQADINNLDVFELETIRKALRDSFKSCYPEIKLKKIEKEIKKPVQLELF